MREADHKRPSLQRRIPDSLTPKINTAPLIIISLRSVSLGRRTIRGTKPFCAARIRRKACTVLSTTPKKGWTLWSTALLYVAKSISETGGWETEDMSTHLKNKAG